MHPVKNALVFIVDDDDDVRDALSWLLRSRHLPTLTFSGADAFLKHVQAPDWQPGEPACVLLDVRMPGMSGLALFDVLLQRALNDVLPVIFLTGHADIPTAVETVKRGAFDFCEKPFSDNALVDRVEAALQISFQALLARTAQGSLQKRLDGLTEREQSVMRCVVDGLPNKLIADQLGISVRTVEVHRSRVFDKLGVKSAVELVHAVKKIANNGFK
jgi:two-component system response regulator DctR